MAIATRTANLFELRCDHTSVTYSTSSLAGPPQLSYSGPEGDHSFSGNEIETLPSALGNEVTVTVATVPDLHTITFTLLLPSFKLPADDTSPFQTIAVKTTHHTTIAGPPEGPGQSYATIALHGVAQAVEL
jgi:hypothetical protein